MKQTLPIIILSSLLVIASGVIVYLVLSATEQSTPVQELVTIEEVDTAMDEESSEEAPGEFVQYFDTGEVVWIGRNVPGEFEDGMPYENYELVKVEDGIERVVFSELNGPCSGADWKTTYHGTFVFSYFESPCEAHADHDVYAFTSSGEQKLRAAYRSPGAEVIFTPDNSYSHVMSLITSNDCTEGEVIFPDSGPEIITETEILGVKISSEDGVEEYLLSEPKTVTCGVTYGYGSVVDPHIYDVKFDVWGFEFTLATGEFVRVRIDSPQGVFVEFPWED